MKKKTLFVCEAAWWEGRGTLVQWSMQPFLQGLSTLHGFRFLYRTFTTKAELKGLLSTEFPSKKSASNIAYIGAHGLGGRLSSGFGGPDINLKPIAESAQRSIEGVWLSACYVGKAKSLRRFLVKSGAVWAGGYTCAMDWEVAMLLDLAVLNTIMSSPRATSQEDAVKLFSRALRSFDPEWKVNSSGKPRVPLRKAICLQARTRGRGFLAENVTGQLLERLGWKESRWL